MANIIGNPGIDKYQYVSLDQLLFVSKEGLLVIHMTFIGGTERIFAFDTVEERDEYFNEMINQWRNPNWNNTGYAWDFGHNNSFWKNRFDGETD